MPYKRIDKNTTEHLTESRAFKEKKNIKKTALDRLAKILDCFDMSETDKVLKEVDFGVECNLHNNKTVDDFRNFVRNLLLKIIEKKKE